jgi:hypothetical protein
MCEFKGYLLTDAFILVVFPFEMPPEFRFFWNTAFEPQKAIMVSHGLNVQD